MPPGLVLTYPLMRTIIRRSLITEDLLRLTYCNFCSPSGVHSLPVLLPPSHRRRLSQNKIVGSYSLSFNGLIDYYTKVFFLSTIFFDKFSYCQIVHFAASSDSLAAVLESSRAFESTSPAHSFARDMLSAVSCVDATLASAISARPYTAS